jgi:hypothetical protein
VTGVKRWALWGAQAILAVGVAWFVIDALAGQWDEFRQLEVSLSIRPWYILLAACLVLLAYVLLVGAWASLVASWSRALPYRVAFRIWAVSNLGRYVPGKIWTVAGLAALARREGASPWAATGSALLMQLLALGTGALIVMVTLPDLGTPMALAAGIILSALGIGAITNRRAVALLARLVGRPGDLRALAPRAATLGVIANIAAWTCYGAAFWLLAGGLLPDPGALTLRASVGIFAAGYLVGLLALFSPGGVGVREAMYLALITPLTGGGMAIALTIGSRLLLTATEITAALLAMAVAARTETTIDHE